MPPSPSSALVSPDSTEPFRVLVIDDDPGVREYLEALVSRQGYRATAVPDGEQALACLDRFRPDIVTLLFFWSDYANASANGDMVRIPV